MFSGIELFLEKEVFQYLYLCFVARVCERQVVFRFLPSGHDKG